MTTISLLLVAAGLVGLAVEVMVRLDRATQAAAPGATISRRRVRRSRFLGADQENPALFILSSVLVLLVVATVV